MVVSSTLVVLMLGYWMIEDTDESNCRFYRLEGTMGTYDQDRRYKIH